jgi:hypothetical protein
MLLDNPISGIWFLTSCWYTIADATILAAKAMRDRITKAGMDGEGKSQV